VIDVPFDLPQFATLLEGRSIKECIVIIDRIRASNHISLAAENRAKMQQFFRLLLLRLINLAGMTPVPVEHIDILVRPMCELARQMEEYAGQTTRDYVAGMEQAVMRKMEEGSASCLRLRSYC